MHILKWPQIQSQSIYFSKFSWGGMPPDPLALASYPCFRTMERIFRCPRYPYALLPGEHFAPQYSIISHFDPLDQNPERNPA